MAKTYNLLKTQVSCVDYENHNNLGNIPIVWKMKIVYCFVKSVKSESYESKCLHQYIVQCNLEMKLVDRIRNI